MVGLQKVDQSLELRDERAGATGGRFGMPQAALIQLSYHSCIALKRGSTIKTGIEGVSLHAAICPDRDQPKPPLFVDPVLRGPEFVHRSQPCSPSISRRRRRRADNSCEGRHQMSRTESIARKRTKLCRAGAQSEVVKRCRTFLRSASHTLTVCLRCAPLVSYQPICEARSDRSTWSTWRCSQQPVPHSHQEERNH